MAAEEKTIPKGSREVFTERLRAKYPDKTFDDDEGMFGQINSDYDDYDNEIAGYKENERKLGDMMASDPRSARFLAEWANGGDPSILLIRLFGSDIKDALDDPEKLEEIENAQKEYLDRVKKDKKLEEEYQDNLKDSIKAIEKMQQDEGLSDEDVDAAMSYIQQIITDGIVGKFSPETISMALKAIKYDGDVADAAAEGEVRGRNARIDEKLRTKQRGDGTPQLDGKNGGAGGNRMGIPSLGALDRYGDDGGDIFARGGEKRVKYQ